MNDIAEYLEQVKTFTDGCREKVGSSGTLEEVLTDVEDLASEDELESDKEINITENGTISIDPSEGYKGIKNLEITTNVEPEITLQDKSVSITSNGTTTVNKDSGYDGINSVSITTNVSPILEEKNVVPTEENQTITPSSGKDGLSQVNVSRIPSDYTKQEGEIEITSDGTYDVSGVLSASVNIGEHETNYLIFNDSEDGWTMKTTIPSDYVELQYISFDTNSYINTQMYPQPVETWGVSSNTVGISTTVGCCKSLLASSIVRAPDAKIVNPKVYSNAYVSGYSRYNLFFNDSIIINNSTPKTVSISTNMYDKSIYYSNITGTQEPIIPTTKWTTDLADDVYLPNAPICINKIMDEDGNIALITSDSTRRIKYFRHWTNGILDRDMVSAKRISDEVVGMYDRVNDVFYTNAGTGTITGGPEVTA